MKYIGELIIGFLVVIIMVFSAILFFPDPCKHEDIGKIFSFQYENSTADNNVRTYCAGCDSNMGGDGFGHYVGSKRAFKGTPNDTSYLDVIREYCDGDEIIGGEYYTMTATIAVGDYNYDKTRIRCRVQSGNIVVSFSVEFREEFEDAVSLLQEDDEITFRGRYYDTGCGWTDCELILTDKN